MSKPKISVAGLAMMLAQLQGVDINVLARAANLPRENVQSWIAGNRSGLRVQSIVHLMGMLGLRMDAGVWSLDPGRVHFWHLTMGVTANADAVLTPLMLLSKMLAGTAITQILPPKRGRGGMWRTDYYMIGGPECRVVVSIKRPAIRRLRVTPEVVKGALWRDDNKHHTMLIPSTHWGHVVARDMTPKEFDQAFNESLGAMAWGDLSMAARQYNLTPEDLMSWIRDRFEGGDAGVRSAATADTEVDVPARARGSVILLGHTGGERRTGTYG